VRLDSSSADIVHSVRRQVAPELLPELPANITGHSNRTSNGN
jgi:hypothetical protein